MTSSAPLQNINEFIRQKNEPAVSSNPHTETDETSFDNEIGDETKGLAASTEGARCVKHVARYVFVYSYPFLMLMLCLSLPLPMFAFVEYGEVKWRCLYVVIVVLLCWILNFVDMVIVGLFPLLLAPLMGVMGFEEVMSHYVTTTTLLYITASTVGGGFQAVNLDKRFALFVMRGSSFELYDVTWRYMVIAGALSMFISDTATMTFLIPILRKMLSLIEEHKASMELDGIPDPRTFRPPKSNVSHSTFSGVCFIVMAYSTCIGGMMTMIGATTNLVFLQNWNSDYPHGTSLNFTTWFLYGAPIGVVSLFFLWLTIILSWEGRSKWLEILSYLCMKCIHWIRRSNPDRNKPEVEAYRHRMANTMESMPAWTYAEKTMLALFILLIVLLFTRDPGISGFGGWHTLFPASFTDTAMPTTFVAVLTLFMPKYSMKEVEYMVHEVGEDGETMRRRWMHERLMTWRQAASAVDWGVIWIFGGGFALSAMMRDTGLATTVANSLISMFKSMDVFIIALTNVLMAALLTEVVSATIVINILTPILIKVSRELRINPLLLSFNAVFAAASAVLIPISSTSNVLAYKSCNLTALDLFRSGWLYKIFSVLIVYAAIYTIGYALFDFGNFPDWAAG